jgi:class 3 adenylate cyclase
VREKFVTKQNINMAVLFADVADSTHLYELLGDTNAFSTVREVIRMLIGITESCGGRVVKTIGDGLMCVFSSADGAANAAGEMQAQIASLPSLPSGKPLAIRVGFHFGRVIMEGNDVFGDSVNVAARMAGLAFSGQALTDADTVMALCARLRGITRPINALPVKGKAEEVEVHELLWQVSGDRTMIPGRTSVPVSIKSGSPRIRLTHLGKVLTFEDTIYFGREASNNHVVMTNPMTSRRHAKIDLRTGKFVLVDQSSNGTFVVIDGRAEEIQLKREEMTLYSTGRFTFGQSTAEPGAEVVEFNCG